MSDEAKRADVEKLLERIEYMTGGGQAMSPSRRDKINDLAREALAALRSAVGAPRGQTEPSRERVALRIAAKLCDELNDEDIHGEAYERYVARVGSDDGGDPSEDDYVDAFVDIANRASPQQQRDTAK